MNESIKIRGLRGQDRDPLHEALSACPEFNTHEVDVALELLDAEIEATGDYTHLVADLDGSVAGYVCISTVPLTDHAWNLYWIVVHPAVQGRGLGRHLLAAAEAYAHGKGGALMVLETSGRPDYANTRAFYEKCGWVAEARIRDFYRPGDDIVYFVRRLT